MTKDCTEVEKMCDELKCDAPRVTKALIESRIVDVDYQTVVIAGQKLMYCGIKMDNGFVAVGKPATCPLDGDNSWKRLLIPNTFFLSHGRRKKGRLFGAFAGGGACV